MLGLDVLFWILRRNELDTIHLYNYLSDVMCLSTGSTMLNFGYWDDHSTTPLEAQRSLCKIFAQHTSLKPNQHIVDIGSGFGVPASIWNNLQTSLQIHCVDINVLELKHTSNSFNQINATSTLLPFSSESVDHVFAFESAQHFKPLNNFFSESYRILKNDGMLSIAIPVTVDVNFCKMGILSFTWLSEHYTKQHLLQLVQDNNFKIIDSFDIGNYVYTPMSDYYLKNEKQLWNDIKSKYPWYLKPILSTSMKKMKNLYRDGSIDYVLLYCKKI